MNKSCLLVIKSANNMGFSALHDCSDIDFGGTRSIGDAGNMITVEVVDIYSWLDNFCRNEELTDIYSIVSITFLE